MSDFKESDYCDKMMNATNAMVIRECYIRILVYANCIYLSVER